MKVGKTYLLQWRQGESQPPYTAPCELTITYGSQVIIKQGFAEKTSSNRYFAAEAVTFKPKTTSGTLTYKMFCDESRDVDL